MQQDLNEINQLKQNGGNILSAPPPGRKKNDALQPDIEVAPKPDKEQIKEQEQIKETEHMKMSGGGVLSGPPSDRKKAPEPVKQDTVPVAPPVKDAVPDAPKQSAAPPVQPVVPEVPKKDSIPSAPPITPEVPKQDSISGQPH